jgi:hypothetical protein
MKGSSHESENTDSPDPNDRITSGKVLRRAEVLEGRDPPGRVDERLHRLEVEVEAARDGGVLRIGRGALDELVAQQRIAHRHLRDAADGAPVVELPALEEPGDLLQVRPGLRDFQRAAGLAPELLPVARVLEDVLAVLEVVAVPVDGDLVGRVAPPGDALVVGQDIPVLRGVEHLLRNGLQVGHDIGHPHRAVEQHVVLVLAQAEEGLLVEPVERHVVHDQPRARELRELRRVQCRGLAQHRLLERQNVEGDAAVVLARDGLFGVGVGSGRARLPGHGERRRERPSRQRRECPVSCGERVAALGRLHRHRPPTGPCPAR